MEDRLMTVRQIAGYLNVNERTVLKLVAEGTLPGVKVGNQWRFRKKMIDTWLDDQLLGVTPHHPEVPKVDRPSPQMLSLASCFTPDHIIPELAAQTKNIVIEELVARVYELGLVRAKTWFVGALIERENVMPSATGNRIAFLHTLQRHPEQVIRPFMVFGRSREGIDFDALDGGLTHLFFVLGLRYQELHLPWLRKLTQMLAREGAVEALLSAPDSAAIYDVLADVERSMEGQGASAS